MGYDHDEGGKKKPMRLLRLKGTKHGNAGHLYTRALGEKKGVRSLEEKTDFTFWKG